MARTLTLAGMSGILILAALAYVNTLGHARSGHDCSLTALSDIAYCD